MPLGAARFGLTSSGVQDLVLIQTQTPSSASTVDFTSIDESKYDIHFVTYTLQCGTDNAILSLRFSDDGGSSYESGSDYKEGWFEIQSLGNSEDSGAESHYRSSSNGEIRVSENFGNGSTEGASGYFYIYNAGNSSNVTSVSGHNAGLNTVGNILKAHGGGTYTASSTINAFRLFDQNQTNSFTGTVSLYGVTL
jgi:hypothetical protein